MTCLPPTLTQVSIPMKTREGGEVINQRRMKKKMMMMMMTISGRIWKIWWIKIYSRLLSYYYKIFYTRYKKIKVEYISMPHSYTEYIIFVSCLVYNILIITGSFNKQ